ncbi:glycoside hydrolase family 2 TIM barrel-domain containing protein [Sphingopyxis sp.]|jgi:beta-galactosidase|uniref:glycoside hydrolase family 2 TIM barrel-domain containing protein n=1 Tax=Sphingopyxis sp. TaxID=1908224 RepID=UPI002DEF38B8|nr:glycoside hydrolase family 2 TIM barrel-domain containing protein [Sphingopyxis sp.]
MSEHQTHGFSRRGVLSAGVAAAAWALGPTGAVRAASPGFPRLTTSFDAGWLFWRGDVDGGERPEFDDRGWSSVHLPHDWGIENIPGAPGTTGDWVPPTATWTLKRAPRTAENMISGYEKPLVEGAPSRVGPFDLAAASPMAMARGALPGGTGWYRKAFVAPALRVGQRVEIQFDGAYSESEIWLNGVKLGGNVYGFGAFSFDITPHLKPGQRNLLAVRVVNVGDTARWYTGSGINRHIWLNITGPVRIVPWGVAVSTPRVDEGSAEVQVDVELENHLATPTLAQVAVELRARGRSVGRGEAQVSLSAGAKGTAQATISLPRPLLWSMEAPNLYTAEVTVSAAGAATDQVSTRFGIRTIAVSKEAGLRINGRQVKLKGACVHSDHGIIGTAAFDGAERRKAGLLKKFGYNAVRLSHHMFPKAFLDACDELGLLVIDEVFDMWEEAKTPGDYSKHFKANWRADMTRLIRQDRNHPSVIFWSLGNEIPEREKPRGAEIAAQLRELVLSLDRSRPITAGINGSTGKKGEITRASLDVVGFNYELPDHIKDHEAYPDMIMMATEQWAADIHDGWRLTQANSWMLGEFVWTGIDYLGEVGVGGTDLRPAGEKLDWRSFAIFLWDYPAFVSGCGEIDILGLRKPQGLYRDVLWGNSALELLVQRPLPEGMVERRGPWSWHDELESWSWPGHDGMPMIVRAYSSGDEVRLMLDGKEVGRKPLAVPADRLTASFELPYRPGELVAVAYRGGREIARKALVTTGEPAQLRLRAERVRLAASPNDLGFVFAEVLDAKGRLVPDAQVPLTFLLEGEGLIKATGSANPRGIKSFTDPRTLTFHGTALAIVQPGYEPGKATVRVTSPGLGSGSLALKIG